MSDELHTFIEAELEARVVAWVLGEASAFEAGELERIVGEKPEVGIFKRRIAAVHGLVGEAEMPVAMRLSADRRARVLEKIGSHAVANEKVVSAKKKRPFWRIAIEVAAVFALGAILLGLFFPAINATKQSSRRVSQMNIARQAELEARVLEEEPAPVPMAKPVAQVTPASANKALGDIQRQLAASSNMPALAAESAPQVPMEAESAKNKLAAAAEPVRGMIAFADGWKSSPSAPMTASAGVAYGGNISGTSSRGDESSLSEMDDQRRNFGMGASSDVMARRAGEHADEGRLVARLESRERAVAEGTGLLEKMAGERSLEYRSKLASVDKDAKAPMKVGDDLMDALDSSAAVAGSKMKRDELGLTQGPASEAKEVFDRPVAIVQETAAAEEPFSTFSLHVSDVSFELARAALDRGELPEAARIRAEEFYNAFDYGDPSPANGEEVACKIEQAAHPVLQQRNLVRIAIKSGAAGRGAGTPLRLTILLDTSGSMEREDRAASVKNAMGVLASLLGPEDRVTLVGFARKPRLLAEDVPGDQAGQLVNRVAQTPSEGGTNLEEALKLASELAARHFQPEAQNRIVLLTDGAANLGNADPARLAERIESLRQRGVAFDACGVGANGLNDEMLESLTRKGDGRYYFLDEPEDADAGFARQLAGAFRPAAENVKLQVRWNPARVGKYRLIGFEKHRLRKEDFRNDKVDAAELAAEEAAVALYQVEVLAEGEGELGEVFVRYRDAASGRMVERSWTVPYQPSVPAFDRAPVSMQLAGVAAMMAEKLSGGGVGEMVQFDELAPVVAKLRGHFAEDARVQALVRMFEQLRNMEGTR